MFKNQYNSNPIIFSPDGQLLQINFATKASERGNLSLSLKSRNHSILFSSLKLEQIQSNKENRIMILGNNISLVTTGISKDGKFLSEILKKKKFEIEHSSNRFSQIPELVQICSKVISRNTYYSNTRPFGIKFLMIGYDTTGPSIIDFNPDGSFQRQNYSAQGKGANKVLSSIENFSGEFIDFSVDELIITIFFIYSESPGDNHVNQAFEKSFSISFLGKNSELLVLRENIIQFYLKIFQNKIKKQTENQIEKTRDIDNWDTDSSVDWSTYDSEM